MQAYPNRYRQDAPTRWPRLTRQCGGVTHLGAAFDEGSADALGQGTMVISGLLRRLRPWHVEPTGEVTGRWAWWMISGFEPTLEEV